MNIKFSNAKISFENYKTHKINQNQKPNKYTTRQKETKKNLKPNLTMLFKTNIIVGGGGVLMWGGVMILLQK